MAHKSYFLLLAAAVIAVNAAGFLLRYLEEDPFIIFTGFRLHISFIIPFLFLFRKHHLEPAKEALLRPGYRKGTLLLPVFAIPLATFTFLFFSGGVDFSEPDHFYEFGLSSVIDYPLYLIWNTPQLFMLFLTLQIISFPGSGKSYKIIFYLFSIFIFEFIPLEKETFNFLPLVSFTAAVLTSAIIFKYFNNIYLFTLFLFTMLWFNFLLYGSSSEEIINILFAAGYEKWAGFFIITEGFREYMIPLNFILTFFLVFIPALWKRRKVLPSYSH